jgi:Mor family transcriptional regulator
VTTLKRATVMKVKIMDVQLQDFPEDSLIHLVAKRDIHLACEILKTYGGKKNYLPKQESIQRQARDREITELRIMLILPGDIARKFGLSRNRILKIIRKGLNLRFPCGPT